MVSGLNCLKSRTTSVWFYVPRNAGLPSRTRKGQQQQTSARFLVFGCLMLNIWDFLASFFRVYAFTRLVIIFCLSYYVPLFSLFLFRSPPHTQHTHSTHIYSLLYLAHCHSFPHTHTDSTLLQPQASSRLAIAAPRRCRCRCYYLRRRLVSAALPLLPLLSIVCKPIRPASFDPTLCLLCEVCL